MRKLGRRVLLLRHCRKSRWSWLHGQWDGTWLQLGVRVHVMLLHGCVLLGCPCCCHPAAGSELSGEREKKSKARLGKGGKLQGMAVDGGA